jgi:hypothetical protein
MVTMKITVTAMALVVTPSHLGSKFAPAPDYWRTGMTKRRPRRQPSAGGATSPEISNIRSRI